MARPPDAARGPAFPGPDRRVDLESWLDDAGPPFLEIRGHDSGCTSYGITVDGHSWFLKAAYGGDRWQLDAAQTVHAQLRHPAVVPLVDRFEVEGDGTVLVYPWVAGENLNDPHVPAALGRDHPRSALNRFRALPDEESLAAYAALLDAHVAAAAAGLVAVDLYDGCLLYDFDARELHLVDLDLYAPAYVLDRERQFGSSRLMPPEELRRGAAVGEPATVYTLARLAWHLGCLRTPARLGVAMHATCADPTDRPQTVPAYTAAWHEATDGS